MSMLLMNQEVVGEGDRLVTGVEIPPYARQLFNNSSNWITFSYWSNNDAFFIFSNIIGFLDHMNVWYVL